MAAVSSSPPEVREPPRRGFNDSQIRVGLTATPIEPERFAVGVPAISGARAGDTGYPPSPHA